MKIIETEIEINSNPGIVWKWLVDFQDYPNWNPYIQSIRRIGNDRKSLRIKTKDPNQIRVSKLTCFDVTNEIRWHESFFGDFIYGAEHYIVLKQEAPDKTKLIQGKKFKGIFRNLLGQKTKIKNGMNKMNLALKNECEQNL